MRTDWLETNAIAKCHDSRATVGPFEGAIRKRSD